MNGLVNLGCAYVELNRYEEAVSLSKRALELNPECLEAHDCLGVALLKNGDREAGLKELSILKRINASFEGDLKKLIASETAGCEAPE